MNEAKNWWYIAHPNGEPVQPVDSPDDIVHHMVYETEEDARRSANHQNDMYDLECEPRILPAVDDIDRDLWKADSIGDRAKRNGKK